MNVLQAKPCTEAYLEVREGFAGEDDADFSTLPLVGKYCGDFDATQIKTRSDVLTARFVMTSGTFSPSHQLGSWTTETCKSSELVV